MNIEMSWRVIIIIIFLQPILNSGKAQLKEEQTSNYELIGKSEEIHIPFEFYGMNLMVKAVMNGINVNLLIDNGVMWDEAWFYGNEQTDSLGFIYDEDVTIVGAGEDEGIRSKTANCPDIVFKDIVFKNQKAIVSSKEEGFAEFFPGMAGQICGTFFKNFIVGFNFDTQMITLYEPGSYSYSGQGIQLGMTKDSSGSYSVPLVIQQGAKKEKMELFIDLGGIYPLSLVVNETFIPGKDEKEVLLGYGASGKIMGYHAKVDEVIVGNYLLKDVPAVFQEDNTGGDNTNLTIGLPLWMKFNLVFDYFNNKLYIEPNQYFNRPFDKP